MITTSLIINCTGMDEQIRRTLIETASQRHNPHYYEATPWLEDQYGRDEAIPTIQICCQSQKEATRLRKKLRDACTPYEQRFLHPRNTGKEVVLNPLDNRVLFKYTNEDGDDIPPEKLPARMAG